jgi:hypothetical protein
MTNPRTRLAIALAAFCAAGVVFVQAATPGGSNKLLLPDAHPVAPFAVNVVTEQKDDKRRYLLAFPSITENVGDGPLEILASRPNRRTKKMRADQLVERADGSKKRYRDVGILRYERSPDHSHWHFQKFMIYELRGAEDNKLLGPDVKTGFCLGDRHRITDRRIPGAVSDPRFVVNCGKSKPRLRKVREGISVGWYDNYDAYLEGQYIDITKVPAGQYVLIHRANHKKRIRETNYDNNASSALIEIRRTGNGKPRAEILERCSSEPDCEADPG